MLEEDNDGTDEGQSGQNGHLSWESGAPDRSAQLRKQRCD